MMVLAVSHNTGDPTAYLQAEARRMAELQQAGLVELMLLKADWPRRSPSLPSPPPSPPPHSSRSPPRPGPLAAAPQPPTPNPQPPPPGTWT